jgi:hypothetical protein
MNALLFRESLNQVILMLPNTFYEIRGDPGIKSSIPTACKEINAGKFHHDIIVLDSRFRGNDGQISMRCSIQEGRGLLNKGPSMNMSPNVE